MPFQALAFMAMASVVPDAVIVPTMASPITGTLPDASVNDRQCTGTADRTFEEGAGSRGRGRGSVFNRRRGSGRGSGTRRGRGRGGSRGRSRVRRSHPSGQGQEREDLSRGWTLCNGDWSSVMLQEEFIDKVVSGRARLFVMSAMDRLHIQRTVREVPRGRCGFVVLFMSVLLSQGMTWLNE